MIRKNLSKMNLNRKMRNYKSLKKANSDRRASLKTVKRPNRKMREALIRKILKKTNWNRRTSLKTGRKSLKT